MTTFENVPASAASWDEDDVDPGETQFRFNVPYQGRVSGGGFITATITIHDGKDETPPTTHTTGDAR